jgi:sulfur relay (sulfurtransferase) DsrC/TusE family protein
VTVSPLPPRDGHAQPHAGRTPRHPRPPLDPSWAPEDALRIAREAGLEALGDHHWKIIASCREEVARTGRKPTLAQIETLTGFDAGQLHALFPGDFDTLVTRIAGLARHPQSPRGHSGGGL